MNSIIKCLCSCVCKFMHNTAGMSAQSRKQMPHLVEELALTY